MENAKHILSVESLSKTYMVANRSGAIPLHALDKVTFELKDGLYGLLGPNGAGKSTLINIITGNLQPDKGHVLWNGKPIQSLGRRYRRILGYCPQQQTLYEAFSGRRFLQYLCALKEIPHNKISDEVDRVSSIVNLTHEMDKKLSAYSGGMKQRLLVAASVIGNPKLVILDEPTAGLDPKERVRFRELMKAISSNKIILIATHVVPDVESVADSVLLLKQGKLAMMNSPEDLIASCPACSCLEDVYLSVFGETE